MRSTTSASDYQEFEVNKAHVRNPNYKGKNYDPNYQKNKQNANYNTNSSHHPSTRYKGNNYNSGGNFNNAKSDYTEKPLNVEVTLKEPVNKEQLFKIQEILRNPRIYRDKLPKGQQPAMVSDSRHRTHSKIHGMHEIPAFPAPERNLDPTRLFMTQDQSFSKINEE